MLLPPPSTKRLRTEIGRAESAPCEDAVAPQVLRMQTEGSESPTDVNTVPERDGQVEAASGAEVAEPNSNVGHEGIGAEAATEAAQAQAQAEADGIANEDVDVEFRPLHGKLVYPRSAPEAFSWESSVVISASHDIR